MLFEVKPHGWLELSLPLGCLLLASTLAAVRPALRAARLDPMAALRRD